LTSPLHLGQGQQKHLGVGFYNIEQILGKGNFCGGDLTKIQIAVKIIDKTQLDSSSLEEIYGEAQLMKLLNLPHIIMCYQVMEQRICIVLSLNLQKMGNISFDFQCST
jgi:MAP/microtubule affinity-regulating kinase